ncbi:MAG: ABC transporter ATP-binding protein, partial [Acidimicrobiales bacterium]
MGMHGMDFGGAGGWRLMHSFRRDGSVKRERLPRGTVKRVGAFARPYRARLAGFFLLIVVSAVVSAVNPLLLRAVIDDGIIGRQADLVVVLALVVAGLALVSAGLSLLQRWISSRVGEGLIYDMRTRVFDHVQRMPIAFFTRTQTGALVSRLNNDVLGAQQAFTDTFSSVVGNLVSVIVTLAAMFFLSWQITLLSLALLPVFVFPSRYVGRRLAALAREGYGLNAEMNTTMTERFNVSGALLVKIFGNPATESREFSRRAGRVRDIGVTQAMYSAVFMT